MPEVGFIIADAMYTRQECRKRGISDKSLSEARQSNVVKPRTIGQKQWYHGAELIEWMKQQSNKNRTANKKKKSIN